MKKFVFFFLLILLFRNLFSQNQFTTIKGHVIAHTKSGTDTALVSGAEIILSVNDSLKLMVLSDAKGYYEFNINKFKGSLTIHCHVTGKTKSVGKNISCLLQNKDHRIINLNKPGDIRYTADFAINEGICDKRVPELNFMENSLEFETDTLCASDKPEDLINSLLEILKDNPSIVLELGAHCDGKEKNKNELSLKRADLIKDILVKKGVAQGRLKTKGFADKQQLITEQMLTQEATSQLGRKGMRCKNRRINFRILSFDYGVQENLNPKNKTDPDEE